MSENRCPHCEAVIPKGKFNCPACGIDVREWNPEKMRCPVCRAMYPHGTKFCLNDGSRLETAVVNFDTEATMFLGGASAGKKEDLIPTMKFADDPDRIIPKMDRDGSGHIAPPHPGKETDSNAEIIMPDISKGFDSPVIEQYSSVENKDSFEMTPLGIENPPVSPPHPKPTDSVKQSPEPAAASSTPYIAPSFQDAFPAPAPPKPKSAHKITPLEEYDKLIKDEKARESKGFSANKVQEELQKRVSRKKQKRGFFGRIMSALKILIGK
jgi:double zinc ribbon protein